MWRELVQQHDPTAGFKPGTTASAIAQAQRLLQVQFPPEFAALLIETDGIVGQYGPHYIWSLATIIENNQLMRTDEQLARQYMPFEHLLFFADAGVDGIGFAFPIWKQGIPTPAPIYRWEPIEDNRILVARSLEEYLIRWLDGKLSV